MGIVLLTAMRQCGEQAGLSLSKHLDCRSIIPTKNIDFSVSLSRQLECFFESIKFLRLGVLCDDDLDIRNMSDIYYLTLQC